MSSRVLVVDDEPQIRRTLELNLAARGYHVDLGLPGMDGLEVVARLRASSNVPIMVLSARDTEESKVAALDAGADDYVTKPFGMGELVARVRAALRRAAPPAAEATVITADFVIDLSAKRVQRAGVEVRLTPTQWHLVEVLVHNEGRLVTQRQLLGEVWGPGYSSETHYLRVFMAQIRRKLEPDPAHPVHFLTEPGMGYRFERS